MNRSEKQTQIDQSAAAFAAAKSVFLVNLAGLTVPQVTELRRRIKAAKGTCTVVKNRLAIRGAKGSPAEALTAFFRGPTGVVTHGAEPVSLAKILTEFAKDHPAFALRAGLVDGRVVEVEGIKTLATLPGLNELRAILLGLISAPSSRLVRVIAAPARQVARVVDERSKKLGGE